MKTTLFHLLTLPPLALLPLALVLIAGPVPENADDKPSQRPPNVVLIMTDDQGWGDIRSHGNDAIDTPVLDGLARAGARFERFYVSPVCAPTRASLLTGRYALRTGTHGVTRGYETMREDEVTLAEVFRNAGYRTGLFGKWHNGAHYPHDPNGQGFEEYLGFAAGHWNNYFDTMLSHNGKPVQTRGYMVDVLTDAALGFMQDHQAEPFFMYLPYNTPHSPFQVPDRYYDKYAARGLDAKNASVYGMVENIDDNIGRLLKTLDNLNLSDQTIVVFLTDNGPNGRDRYNGHMRGAKGSVHEGGVRVPLFVRWPGVIPENTVIRSLAAHIDLLPTLAALAGISVETEQPLDGMNLAPLLRTGASGGEDRLLFSHWRFDAGSQPEPGAVRSTRWRAVLEGGRWTLFDMLNDPGQQADVSKDYPEVAAHLREAYNAWFEEVTAAGFAPIPTQVGHPDRPVILPAHEAILSPSPGDGIAYDGRSGWANDWITRWTNMDAYATWPIEVVEAGTYGLSLQYHTPPERLDARFRVEVGGQALVVDVTQPHDTPFRFSPDRVLRGEVYERTWKTISIGELALPAGQTRLVLYPTRLTGGLAPDVKSIILERVE